jgi:hypothetical protein
VLKRIREVTAYLLAIFVFVVFFFPAEFGLYGQAMLFGAIVLYAVLSSSDLSAWDRAKHILPVAVGVAAVYKSNVLADEKRFDEATYALLSGGLFTAFLWLIIGKAGTKTEKPL